MPDRPVAILVTGSRDWNNEYAIREALERFKGRQVMVIHGDADGADTLADKVAGNLGFKPLRFPVLESDRVEHGPFNAPKVRNQRMVDRLCLSRERGTECHVFAFPTPESRGTWDCSNKAKAAGFRVEVIR